MDQHEEEQLLPKKVRIIEESPIASASSAKLNRNEQMIKTTREILERLSVEESVLVGQGEDSSVSFGSVPVFSRPLPAGRSRSNTCTSSSGADTPSLSSDGSSISGGSQSSIDLAQLNSLLTNSTRSLMSNASAARRTRLRARGQGHRHRYSARVSRHSVYETIEEDNASPATVKSFRSNTKDVPVIVVSCGSVDLTASDGSLWNGERGIDALDRYYTLITEVEDAVVESKRIWLDTVFVIRRPKVESGQECLAYLVENVLETEHVNLEKYEAQKTQTQQEIESLKNVRTENLREEVPIQWTSTKTRPGPSQH
ncbi:hypothetical protein F5887DRAFT_1186100 [Amanita rubescens]|nr:hypothetical protein F5887DRAFT_1213195 [Amanita rubescens]KAF8328762.1 hypothetical protein F5887DRAFT_1186100 [Amanita rubescens]